MSSRDKSIEADRFISKGADVRVSGGHRTPSGGEVWQVASDGGTLNLTTSSSSVAVMDVAVKQYSAALKRLAKK
jgi:hypothetical protein